MTSLFRPSTSNVLVNFPFEVFEKKILSSLVVAIVLPLGESATDLNRKCPSMVSLLDPVETFHKRIVPFQSPLTSILPTHKHTPIG